MVLRRLGRYLGGRRLSIADHAVEAVRAGKGGNWWAAGRLLAVSAISYRWRAAGMAFELGRQLWRRGRG